MSDKNYKEKNDGEKPECPETLPYFTMEDAHRAIKGELDLLGCMDIDDEFRQSTDPNNSYSRT